MTSVGPEAAAALGLTPEEAGGALAQNSPAYTGTGDDRKVPWGPRRRDTPHPDNRAALSDTKLRDVPTEDNAKLLGDDAYALLGQDRARAEQGGDYAYGLGGEDFARAQRAVGSDAPGAQESRDAMERDTTKTAVELKMEALRMKDPEIARIAKEMIDAGLLPEDYDRRGFEKAWANLVDLAADWHQANPGSFLTPEDMIDVYAGQRGTGDIGSARKPGEPGGPSVTDVTNNVELSDSQQAWNLLRSMMRTQLGRKPSDTEVDSFQAALNAAQTKAPVITNRTTKTDASGNSVVNQTKTGGVDPEGFAEQYIEDNHEKEFGHYQAATTYYNALTEAIKRPV